MGTPAKVPGGSFRRSAAGGGVAFDYSIPLSRIQAEERAAKDERKTEYAKIPTAYAAVSYTHLASGRLADLSVITEDNSRFEDVMDIIADIKTGIDKTTGKYIVIPDRTQAIRWCIEHAQDGDIIVLDVYKRQA